MHRRLPSGLLPTFSAIGWAAPVLLVLLRLLQGLALGGEYGGAATYVAEHAAENRRGYDTSWIQTTATLGFFLALIVILVCRINISKEAFARLGLAHPVPGFAVPAGSSRSTSGSSWKSRRCSRRSRAKAQTSKAPLTESFANWSNGKIVLLALLGATAGQGVVWYTGQFYALFFLIITLKLEYQTAYILIALSLVIGTPFFIFFGWLSDKIGRKNIIMAGCLLAVLTYFPLFKALTHYVNPDLEAAAAKTQVTVAASDCSLPHLRRTVVEIQRLRQGEGLPHQAGHHVRIAAGGGRQERRHQDR